MKKILTPIFVGIGIFVLIVFWFEIFGEYLANHQYYYKMMGLWSNRKLIIWSIISAAIPLAYVFWNKKFSLKLFLGTLFVGLMVFSTVHVGVKSGVWIWAGWIKLLINTALLFVLWVYFLFGSMALWSIISNKLLKLKENRWQEMLISFWLWLWGLLFFVRYLIQGQLFFSWLIWLIFIWLGVAIYFQRNALKYYSELISEIFANFCMSSLKNNKYMIIWVVLFVFSLIYYLYGFQLSFIPYSTAWDANHAYMYLPKVWSLHNGAFWQNGPGNWFVGLWHAFIAFWFSLIKPLGNSWLAPDTIAVAMNFLSGVLVLIFGLWLTKEVIDFFVAKKYLVSKKATIFKSIVFFLWWFILLLWLTSGMWAFLVFVDNKTDLGVMAMTVLAMLSGFVFLFYLKEHKDGGRKLNKEWIKYLLISWFMFALASIAKQTAFFDMALFGLLLIGLWFGILFGIWWWVFLLGFLWKLSFGNTKDFISADSSLAIWLMIIWTVIIGFWFVNMFLKKRSQAQKTHSVKLLKYFGIWVIWLIATFVIWKGPGVIYQNIVVSDGFSIGTMAKQFIFSIKVPTYLLAMSGDEDKLSLQSIIDQRNLEKNTKTVAQCNAINYTEEELHANLKEVPKKNEDVWRYVWYGWKEFKQSEKVFGLWYGILRTFFHIDGKCYAFSRDVKSLCVASSAIDSFDVKKLRELQSGLDHMWNSYKLLTIALDEFDMMGYKEDEPQLAKLMRDEIINIRQYYQWNSVLVLENSIKVPYRYVVPLNISYNWSLQNLSSYYTDIGFVWLFAMMFILLSIIYALFARKYKLVLLSAITLIGWILRWAAWWGIMWYGMWLIMWTALVFVTWIVDLLFTSEHEKKGTFVYVYVLIWLFVARGLIQFMFNLVRISSQWAGGPFARYKMWVGEVIEISPDLQQIKVSKHWYTSDDVFDLQFPHYNWVMKYLKDRNEEDGVLIAGTYLSYFLDKQENLKYDGMLTNFWKNASDNDSCKTYQRLKNQNTKYIVIDPNIGTVVMWEWNETLFDRFFAKRDPVTGLIEEHGAISMLVQLKKDWFVRLLKTNNLGAKYAFSLSDDAFKSVFGEMDDSKLLFLRAQLSIARFFPNSQQLMWFIAETFSQRVQNGEAVGDIADVYGKIIDEEKVSILAKNFLSKKSNPYQMQQDIETLTQGERLILSQYLGIYNMKQTNSQSFQSMVNQLMQTSLAGSSQLIVMELVN